MLAVFLRQLDRETLLGRDQIVLLALFSMRAIDVPSRRLFYGMSAWVLIGTAPAITFFFIAPDLQSSRYLYLATIGWAGLLVAMTARGRVRQVEYITSGFLVVLIASGVFGVRWHLEPWRQAAAARDRFELAAEHDPRVMGCSTQAIGIRNPPDSVKGAFVLRNGAVEALRRDLRVAPTTGASDSDCVFAWNDLAGRFER